MNQEQHEMILDKTHPSGADEWYCPTCGRRLIMDYQPNFKKTVLDPGNEFAAHCGGKGGLRIGSMQVSRSHETAQDNEPMIPIEDPRLDPWNAWLDEVGFENLWREDSQ